MATPTGRAPGGSSIGPSPPSASRRSAAEHSGATPAPAEASPPADLSLWRKEERARLIEARLAVPAATRKRVADAVATHLDRLVEPGADTVVSLYWGD